VKGRVLVIEDDQDISLSIRTVLSRNGFEVTSEADGKDGLRAFHSVRPDLVILDIGLPTLDGWSVLERIRDLSDAPVLILTAHGRESDKVRGLHGGADDYLTKPFGNSELAARVEALLRRPRSAAPPADVFDDGSLQVQLESREVSVNGQEVSLTPTEYRLLAALIKHPGQTLTPEQLLKLAWNDPFGVGPDRVKFGVMRLRRKLSQNASPGRDPGSSIEAVRGFGYRYVAPKALSVPGPRRPSACCPPGEAGPGSAPQRAAAADRRRGAGHRRRTGAGRPARVGAPAPCTDPLPPFRGRRRRVRGPVPRTNGGDVPRTPGRGRSGHARGDPTAL
jgi:DNA-binding response OmpR family regulator